MRLWGSLVEELLLFSPLVEVQRTTRRWNGVLLWPMAPYVYMYNILLCCCDGLSILLLKKFWLYAYMTQLIYPISLTHHGWSCLSKPILLLLLFLLIQFNTRGKLIEINVHNLPWIFEILKKKGQCWMSKLSSLIWQLKFKEVISQVFLYKHTLSLFST